MKDLTQLFNQCMWEVEQANIKTGNIVSVSVNTRAKNRWGQTKKKGDKYYITISDKLLDDNISDFGAKNTLIHEILHTVSGCMNHKSEWQAVANIMNRKYNYNIKRTSSASELNVKVDKVDYRYNVVCKNCGKSYNYNRAGNVVKYPSRFRCGACNGELKVLINDSNFVLLSANNKK